MREEPDALIAHVRICGSPGEVTTQGHPAAPRTSDKGRLAEFALSFEQAMRWRRYLVSNADEFRADHEFFLALDERSHPQSPKQKKKKKKKKKKKLKVGGTDAFDSMRLSLALSARYKRRAEAVHLGGDIGPTPQNTIEDLRGP